MTTWYLGLSTSGHDPALALVNSAGQVVFAEATERFVQDKRAWGIVPDHVGHLAAALAFVGCTPDDKIIVATSWAASKQDLGREVHDALLPATDTLWMQGLQSQMQYSAGASLLRLGFACQMPEAQRFDHHLCHAVTACYFSPVEDAACMVLDGEGDVGAVSSFQLRGRKLSRNWRSWGPGSLGTFYGWLTGLCGFDWREGEEWKVMGLAAFGRADPVLVNALCQLLAVDRGRLRFAESEEVARIRCLLEPYRRRADAPVMEAADLAATAQAAYRVLADRVLASTFDEASGNLILTGGCALNSSYNGTLIGRGGLDQLFVPPCPADDGNAIGAALLAWMKETGETDIPFGGGSPFLGSRAKDGALAACRQAVQGSLSVTEPRGDTAGLVARRLAQGQILGVMRGRAEFGPRALGNRSIIADPRGAATKERLNRLVKGREPFRPFAPVVAETDMAEWFEKSPRSPYMAMALPFTSRAKTRVHAVVHEDGTGRVQGVSDRIYPWMSELLRAFGRETGVPVLLNTSFNIMGKPILHDVQDAVAMLMTSGLDGVMIEDTLIEKGRRDHGL